ncbi:hypothetical protein [uncultured Amphritea sp.]|uniref:hypothetical protein n=1 Tax=uncultured Amphritea sp. TaxID=981605 RepID=UPI002633DFB5|nr:hypothetical protein [uncultured Amphritea sp.]
MPDIDTYSPRKVTDQNRDLLPATHDPEKRKTYVEITLQEPEIQEAIRNYIRGMYPTLPDEELPVKIIAGRGENGHSATIIKEPIPITVNSPSQPKVAVASYTAAQEDANRRNGEEAIAEGSEDAETVQETDEAPETTGEPEEDGTGPEPGHVQSDGNVLDVKDSDTAPDESAPADEPESAPETTSAEPTPTEPTEEELTTEETAELVEAVKETSENQTGPIDPEEPTPTPKKSSLFDTPKPVEDNSSAAEAAATPPEAESETPAEASAPKPKSIFDN